MEFGFWSVLPPIVAIGLAMATRQVFISLLLGVWAGWLIAAGGNPLTGTRETVTALVAVFTEAWQSRVILFTLLVGSLLILMQHSGGVDGFIKWASGWKLARTRRGAQVMAWFIGLGVFIESTITCLVVGTVSRPLFDRLKISREKLAYICDSTSAPVCILLPINGWGATVLGLLGVQAVAGHLGDTGPLTVFLAAIPLNFYAILAVILVLITCLTDWTFGPMKEAERRAREEGKLMRDGAMPVVAEEVIAAAAKPGVPHRMVNMLVPLFVMVAMTVGGIAITGWPGLADAEPDAGFAMKLQALLNEASGSLAVLWGISLSVAVAAIMLRAQGIFDVKELTDLIFKGAGGLIPLAAIMWLAFAIGMVCQHLGTGPWVAEQVQPYLSPALIAPVVFLTSCFIAFATGTSWGTFAIMIPLAVPLASAYISDGASVSMALVVSAVLGGGVFGDHCSPISDTSVVSSMASCSDHIDHVRTQLPFALLAGGLATALYLVVGIVLA